MSGLRPYLRPAFTDRSIRSLNISYPIILAINLWAVVATTIRHGGFQVFSVLNVISIVVIVGLYALVLRSTAVMLRRREADSVLFRQNSKSDRT